jgi:ribosomal protein L37AE/L43A
VRTENFFPTIAKFREALADVIREHRNETPDRWQAPYDCPVCGGTGTVDDGDGRLWQCKCAVRTRVTPATRPALHGGQAERFAKAVDAAWAALAERGTKKHRHGGPDPCPVCGGGPPLSNTNEPLGSRVADLHARLAERRRRLGVAPDALGDDAEATVVEDP